MKKRMVKFVVLFIISYITIGCVTARQYESYGNQKFALGNYADSISYYEQALSINPKQKTALLMLGWSYFKLERYEEAMKAFGRLRDLDEGSVESLEGIGWTTFKLGRYKESLKVFEALREKDGQQVGAVEGIAYSYFKLGDLKKAKEYLKIALVENPRSSDNNLIRGWVANMESDYPTAIKFFKRALDLSVKEDLDAYAALGSAYLGNKDYNKADFYYNMVLNKDPKHQGALAGKQQLLVTKRAVLAQGADQLAAGDYDAALKEYREVEKLYPEWAEVYAAKGWAMYKKGDYKGAYSEFKKGVNRYNLSYDLYDGLGWSSLKAGQKAKAEESFKKALEIYSNYRSSQAGLKELEGLAENK